MVGKPFQKGQSGNPGGRTKVVAEVKELARQHTVVAMQALADIVQDIKAAPAARVAAASTILDRGWGKAQQHITVEKSPLDELDAPTLAALADALGAAERSAEERDATAALH